MKVGIIGTGNMGKVIIEAFIESKAISPSRLYMTNRTLKKAKLIQETTGGHVLNSSEEVIKSSDIVFICVKPHDVYRVIEENKNCFTEDKCAVSITSPVSLDQLQSILPCSCARFIPSITNRALSGVSLLTFGSDCTEHWKGRLTTLAEHISTPVLIREEVTRVASDIVSCGPAFFSYLTQRFINAAVEVTEIDPETATILASEMLVGLGDLLKKEIYSLPALQEKVCVKGGVTGKGIDVMERELGEVFEKLFQATQEKFADDITETQSQFGV
ncbi:late competence protein ComER [Rossellomorea aquimaris]|uniref:Late competence protein ComER n=1 Tax=Rossellomorea aquimaris TaxID=189382 RepID=A0A1J6WQY6_9BACI|nr:late competence protein ComER [Rossellomorea aquimaris]OIU70627.1 late competence protein ComER [Rossellomorea aquimaris]